MLREGKDRAILDRTAFVAAAIAEDGLRYASDATPGYRRKRTGTSSNGHIQATGLDARRRKRFRHHPTWRELREQSTYEHVMQFAATPRPSALALRRPYADWRIVTDRRPSQAR